MNPSHCTITIFINIWLSKYVTVLNERQKEEEEEEGGCRSGKEEILLEQYSKLQILFHFSERIKKRLAYHISIL